MTSLCLGKEGAGWQPDSSRRVRAPPPPPPFRLSIDVEIPVVDPLWHLPGDSRLFRKTGRRCLSNATKPWKNYTPRAASQGWQARSPSLFLFFFIFLCCCSFFSSFFPPTLSLTCKWEQQPASSNTCSVVQVAIEPVSWLFSVTSFFSQPNKRQN